MPGWQKLVTINCYNNWSYQKENNFQKDSSYWKLTWKVIIWHLSLCSLFTKYNRVCWLLAKSPSNFDPPLKKLLNQTDADGPDSQDGRALKIRVSNLGISGLRNNFVFRHTA